MTDDTMKVSEPGESATPRYLDAGPTNLKEYVGAYLQRVRSGQLGAVPIIIGMLVIIIIFGLQEPIFFNQRNFVNLLLQMAGITTMAIGVVFVLLIGEIDLSIGFVSGVVGVTMTLLLRPGDPGFPWFLAIGIALIVAAAIGLLQGLIITKANVPSFVVTLAGFLAWSGVVLIMTTQWSTAGTIIIQDSVALGIANQFLPVVWGWIFFVGIVGGWTALQLFARNSRRARGLPSKPLSVILIQLVALAAVLGLAIGYANAERGVPVVTVILAALLLFWNFVATKTRFGRHVYAVGGNAEAARRAGIKVDSIRVRVFMISSFMAGVGGLILASRLRSVDTSAGGGNLLLNAIAAAVIGGTSLFGGHGSVVSALYGGIIIALVNNGMGLLGWPSGVKFVVTGLVLLAAVLVDSYSRRKQAVSGVS
ncbi:MAG: ABC transporter permease [Acidimicrobiia bacterium]|nr:MAG: ABC transporter permease [Acidimicrobiia bacterium]